MQKYPRNPSPQQVKLKDMRQSELIGNYKKYKINTLYDNTIGQTNRNIDAVRFEGAKNTCEITTAIHNEGEATRALINANTMQALRDKLADKDRELMTANFQLSQQAQNAYLINEIRPCARPAYLTCSPYTTANFCGGCNA